MNRVYSMFSVLFLVFSIVNCAFSNEITDCKSVGLGSVVYKDRNINVRIQGITDNILRITCSKRKEFLNTDSLMIVKHGKSIKLKLNSDNDSFTISTPQVSLVLNKKTGSMSFLHNEGKLAEFRGVELSDIDMPPVVYKNKKVVKGYTGKLLFNFGDDEAIYGFGQNEEGYFNYRGKHQYLYQHNLKAVMPIFLSSRGYGLLFDTYAFSKFRDEQEGSFFWTKAVKEFDFYFIYGPKFDKIVAGTRMLTGNLPMFPKWSYGYIQSKERYKTQQELVDVVDEYRKRDLPLDCVVQDWMYWPSGWGGKEFDPKRFPDMNKGISDIHKKNVKFMISIWPHMNKNKDGREMVEKGYMLANNKVYNAFNADARKLYWQQAYNGLFRYGVDAWWCDCTEPVDADWGTVKYITPEKRAEMNTAALRRLLGPEYLNAFSLVHSKGIYNNQRKTTEEKRVLNLTRSGYPGQQRYATITWSGDIGARWSTLKKEIAEGLSFTVTGNPRWTLDTGAFFVNKKYKYFRSGDFNGGVDNFGYRELYTRWFEFATFLPMMRSHGTHTPREIWQFGEKGEMFYDTLVKYNDLRHRLIPYIYSNAAAEVMHQYTMLRMLAFDFINDKKAIAVDDEYMFGPALLVAPVTNYMYYNEKGEKVNDRDKNETVYLPNGTDWFSFWDGKRYTGGKEVKVNAPIDILPLFVRAGAIIPLGPEEKFVGEKKNASWELRIYPGADGKFTVYEDEGDNYNYEKGAFATYDITWNDKNKSLIFSERKGKFKGMCETRKFNIVVVTEGHGVGENITSKADRVVEYNGKKLKVDFNQ